MRSSRSLFKVQASPLACVTQEAIYGVYRGESRTEMGIGPEWPDSPWALLQVEEKGAITASNIQQQLIVFGHEFAQFVHVTDWLAVGGGDHIVFAQTRLPGGAALFNIQDDYPRHTAM